MCGSGYGVALVLYGGGSSPKYMNSRRSFFKSLTGCVAAAAMTTMGFAPEIPKFCRVMFVSLTYNRNEKTGIAVTEIEYIKLS